MKNRESNEIIVESTQLNVTLMMDMLLHNIDINGKRARLFTGFCNKTRKGKGVE